MVTSLITLKDELEKISLDIIYSQWCELGCNLNAKPIGNYLIDHDALLWFSLEFVHKDARLREQIAYWLDENPGYISKSIVKKSAENKNDSRMAILDDLLTKKRTKFDLKNKIDSEKIKLSPHCLLTRTIPLLGNDLRRMLIMLFIANPHGLTGEQIIKFTKYSKRMVYETLGNLEKTGFLYKEKPIYYLLKRDIWCSLLECPKKINFFNSNDIFESVVTLLRTLTQCIKQEIPFGSRIVTDAFSTAENKIIKAAFPPHEKQKTSGGVTELLRSIFSV